MTDRPTKPIPDPRRDNVLKVSEPIVIGPRVEVTAIDTPAGTIRQIQINGGYFGQFTEGQTALAVAVAHGGRPTLKDNR
jgi:hypothetical protein